jgi:hypothetical protein
VRLVRDTLGSVLLFVLPVFLLGCGNTDTSRPLPGTSPASTPGAKAATADKDNPTKPEKPLTVTAEEITKTYFTDQKAGDKEYKDKDIQIGGVVQHVRVEGKNPSSTLPSEVHLTGAKVENPVGSDETTVSCMFPEHSPDNGKLEQLKKGQRVRIQGTCYGRIGGFVQLEKCKLVEGAQ